ncbi:alpha/beta fold hydrolase [Actinoplanes regularis]|uniref:alpha/beta fold hydrolase n=1 Tax=Actinoplanes regularis TaxID=52697 RepID=UPI0024A1A45F|nr:alpha/beta fold hydrolase [Actinoplanes regularis]GLW34532.1 hypothetical protein Areg01_74690 [Actinoplanes regularis]
MNSIEVAQIAHRFVDVDGVQVFYREAGPRNAPVLLLLHGFPSASHQFRRLFDVLGTRYRLIAPDYPGFGHTRAPADFDYTFDRLADVIEGFVRAIGLDRYVLYAFDFGGPVGLRLAQRRPEAVAGLIVQNANAYAEGLSDLAQGMVANRPGVDGAEERVREILVLPVTRGQYEDGTTDPALISPDGWTLDQHFLDQPGRKQAQVSLALDYHSNVALYPRWQRWLAEHRPPALILWGRNDAFFPEAGAHAYRRDLPDAEVHVFDTGHFALEERLPEIAPLIGDFLTRTWKGPCLKLAVIGASGNLGGAAVREAQARGHRVTALRRADVDVTDPAAIERAVAGHDAVIVSVKGPDRLVPRAARALLEALPASGVPRLIFLGGGGSLTSPSGQRFVDLPAFPAQYRETALDQAAALDLLRAAGAAVEWTYVSPPPVHLVPGDKTGEYRAEAQDSPVLDATGESRVTVGDYASAVIDAAERRTFVRQRFTVGY